MAAPRLCVNKTNAHIHAQVIDDESGKTLAAASTLDRSFRKTETNRRSKASGKAIGEQIAKLCSELKIGKVVFDRGSSKYHGVVAELADAARAGGLKF